MNLTRRESRSMLAAPQENFGLLFVSHSSKGAPPHSKLMELEMKMVKVEMVRRASEEEASEKTTEEAVERGRGCGGPEKALTRKDSREVH